MNTGSRPQRSFGLACGLIAGALIITTSAHAIAGEDRNIITENSAVISEKVLLERVRIVAEGPDGEATESTLTFLQIFPKANREYTCLAVLDSGKVQDMDCFPIKTNPTPIMY